jgi:hypothetical protein
MSDRRIRNMSDLRRERARVNGSIGQKEKELAGDYHQVIESITPQRVITGIAAKLVTTAPALYTAYSIFRSVFGRKNRPDKE